MPFEFPLSVSNLTAPFLKAPDFESPCNRLVKALIDGGVEAGSHALQWEAFRFSAGVYIYKLTAGDQASTKRMILLK